MVPHTTDTMSLPVVRPKVLPNGSSPMADLEYEGQDVLTSVCAIAICGTIHKGHCEPGDSGACCGHHWDNPERSRTGCQRECDSAICRHLRSHARHVTTCDAKNLSKKTLPSRAAGCKGECVPRNHPHGPAHASQ